MPEGLDKLAGGVGKAIETIPDLYDDAFKPATQESGKTLALIPRAINAALVPLRQWIAEREYKLAETEKLLAKKLEHVGEDKIVTPEAYIAVPAIQAISYSMDSEELRNLYANLLAKAMNIDTKDFVHPSFVEIIKQMSPIDVRVLEEVAQNKPFQVANIYCCKYQNSQESSELLSSLENPIEKLGFEGITHITYFSPDLVKVSLDNLLRLRLVEERFRIDTSLDDKIKMSPIYKNMVTELKKYIVDSSWKYEETSHYLSLTNFGKTFHDICLNMP